jgi:hypothetical protein
VEVGPLVSFTADAWRCVYELVQGDLGSGWGLDYYWCVYARDVCHLGYPDFQAANVAQERRGGNWGFTCAVVDSVHIAHLDERTATGLFGKDYQVSYQCCQLRLSSLLCSVVVPCSAIVR